MKLLLTHHNLLCERFAPFTLIAILSNPTIPCGLCNVVYNLTCILMHGVMCQLQLTLV